MKVLSDLWASFSGAAKVRVSDPFIGAFFVSWLLFNWNQIALLFWGEGKASERISNFDNYIKATDLFSFNSVLVLPLFFSFLYLFLFPWISFFVKGLLSFTDDLLYRQAIDSELRKVRQQEDLNKAKILSDPEKKFIEQSVQLELDRRKELMEQRKHRGVRMQAKAEEQVLKAKEASDKAKETEITLQNKARQAELESRRFSVHSDRLKAEAASHRFPSAYLFLEMLDESLRADDQELSLGGLGEVVAAIFGYDSFADILYDKEFNNESFSEVSYVYYDSESLASRLEQILLAEGYHVNLTPGDLFDHIVSIFEILPYNFVDLEMLTEAGKEFAQEKRFSLLESEGVAGAISESDTYFEEVEIDEMRIVGFDRGFFAKFDANASGVHRNDSEVPGRGITIELKVESRLKVGRRALGGFEFSEVQGHLNDYC
ncbi:hypothetical protein [Pseudomonas sp. RL]|uniref:hypothetical protein n=1 Tax=Pseudomonas sp. RL TaxID=1452718 RepID=UPI0012DEC7C3|nr:hypothetical protein [Pseudomonas sp. RL]